MRARFAGLVVAVFVPTVALMHPSCKHPDTPADEGGSEVKFAQGLGGATHGHEKLTELAVVMANDALHPENGDVPTGFARALPWNWGAADRILFYPEDQLSQPAYRNTHPMTWGSLSADFPPTTRNIKITELSINSDRDSSADVLTKLNFLLCAHYDLIDASQTNMEAALRAKLKQCDGMPYSGDFQDVHFLRGWKDTTPPTLKTAKQTCTSSQERVRSATVKALKAWEAANLHDPDNGLDRDRYQRFTGQYFLGLAMHTIQDAFSGAHVDRDPVDPRKINKICHYNETIIKQDLNKNICRHKVPFDPRDLIWKGGEVGNLTATRYVTGAITRYISRVRGDFDNLTHEGQGAVAASMSYLITFAKILSEMPQDANGKMNFTGKPAEMKAVNDALDQFFNFKGDPGEDHLLQGAGFMNCGRIVEQI